MAVKQVFKRVKMGVKPVKKEVFEQIVENTTETVVSKTPKKNKKEKENTDMNITSEQFDKMDALVQDINAPREVKIVKKDRGLIERTESSKIVLTEDNRQVLND